VGPGHPLRPHLAVAVHAAGAGPGQAPRQRQAAGRHPGQADRRAEDDRLLLGRRARLGAAAGALGDGRPGRLPGRGLSLDTNAKGFFALGNALLDASIATWHTKVVQDTVRPITYIRWLYKGKKVKGWSGPGSKLADEDGGAWIPYQEANVVSPPFGEYTSGHSAGAAQRVFNLVAGSDDFKLPCRSPSSRAARRSSPVWSRPRT